MLVAISYDIHVIYMYACLITRLYVYLNLSQSAWQLAWEVTFKMESWLYDFMIITCPVRGPSGTFRLHVTISNTGWDLSKIKDHCFCSYHYCLYLHAVCNKYDFSSLTILWGVYLSWCHHIICLLYVCKYCIIVKLFIMAVCSWYNLMIAFHGLRCLVSKLFWWYRCLVSEHVWDFVFISFLY